MAHPVSDGQLVAIKHGESGYLIGRIRCDSSGQWLLDHSEFVGHTYVNTPLSGSWLAGLEVVKIKQVGSNYYDIEPSLVSALSAKGIEERKEV